MKNRKISLAATLLLSTSVAFAEDVSPLEVADYSIIDAIKGGTPMTSFRIRYETVDQDPSTTFTHDARALTLRSLVGWQTA
ncbi:MAG: hypothetical protein K8Q92_04205, partial [Methylophilales bacterium]|nr:hypothetical protein [Methylophilales bacterium]